jgi:hypothetical protein
MTRDEVVRTLRERVGRRVRVTFADGDVLRVDVAAVDDEGFLHSGPDSEHPAFHWTPFESIALVQPDAS